MKYVDEYRGSDLVHTLTKKLQDLSNQPVRIMEVCGTHTMSIFKHGLRQMLPKGIQLISGPGCPVCVTPSGVIDAFVELAGRPEVIIATFGDMIRVPGTGNSLMRAKAAGADVNIVYSPMDSLKIAEQNPDKLVVFLSVGFETTTPTIAATILEADRRKIGNFCIFPANKTMPAPLKVLMEDPKLQVDGLLCPGHVSIISGSENYRFLVDDYGIACVVAGFEPTDILLSVIALVKQVQEGRPALENCYGRVVTAEGNVKARKIVDMVFTPVDSEWRGLGSIKLSGLTLREEYRSFDVIERLEIQITPSSEPKGCRCGDVLKGIAQPPDCPIFGNRCTPGSPVGPCMVSSEGTCAAWYRYGALS